MGMNAISVINIYYFNINFTENVVAQNKNYVKYFYVYHKTFFLNKI